MPQKIGSRGLNIALYTCPLVADRCVLTGTSQNAPISQSRRHLNNVLYGSTPKWAFTPKSATRGHPPQQTHRSSAAARPAVARPVQSGQQLPLQSRFFGVDACRVQHGANTDVRQPAHEMESVSTHPALRLTRPLGWTKASTQLSARLISVPTAGRFAECRKE